MPSYAIFVGFPADDWNGPVLLQWEPGLVEKDYLALRADEADGDASRWVGCRLRDLERVRWCAVSDGAVLPCCQAEVLVRGTGTVYIYASRSCLTYLESQGVPLSEMRGADAEACRTLWAELSDADAELSAEVCGLVNAALN